VRFNIEYSGKGDPKFRMVENYQKSSTEAVFWIVTLADSGTVQGWKQIPILLYLIEGRGKLFFCQGNRQKFLGIASSWLLPRCSMPIIAEVAKGRHYLPGDENCWVKWCSTNLGSSARGKYISESANQRVRSTNQRFERNRGYRTLWGY